MRSVFVAALLGAITVSLPALADDRGGEGENCRARSDCAEGLRCLRGVCTSSQSAPIEHVEPAKPAGRKWAHFKFDEGTHGFIGFTLIAGVDHLTVANDKEMSSGSLTAITGAVRGGVFLNRHEIALEVAPFTSVLEKNGVSTVRFDVSASYGYLLRLASGRVGSLYIPLRLGVGGAFAQYESPLFLARVETGLAVAWGHFLFDFHVPWVRYLVGTASVPTGVNSLHHLVFGFGATLSYTF